MAGLGSATSGTRGGRHARAGTGGLWHLLREVAQVSVGRGSSHVGRHGVQRLRLPASTTPDTVSIGAPVS
jgi:hypothetical protein